MSPASSRPLPRVSRTCGESQDPFRNISELTEWIPDIPFSLCSKANSGMTMVSG